MSVNQDLRTKCPKCGALSYNGGYCPMCETYRPSKRSKVGDHQEKEADEHFLLPLGMRLGNMEETEEEHEENIDLWYERQAKKQRSRLTFSEEDFKNATITLNSVVKKIGKVSDGDIIDVLDIPWEAIVDYLDNDWTRASEIPWRKWEEIVAGAYKRHGFDVVILTNRSGDHGRDIVAEKKGFCSIKIIDSVKAYKPGHLVSADDVRSLIGVMHGDQSVSKGILSTTSDFAPRLREDPFIKPFLDTRLDLMHGKRLMNWFNSLRQN